MAHLNTAFPTLLSSDNNYAALRTLDEDAMKSPQGKEDWRKFVMAVSLPPLSFLGKFG